MYPTSSIASATRKKCSGGRLWYWNRSLPKHGNPHASWINVGIYQTEERQSPRKHFRVISDERHKLFHARKLGARRLLRPAKVPKAPQNSTQFIIDDHENSAYFIDFEKGFTSPSTRDDVGWSPYFEQDFENVYRTTREAEIIDWTHEVLVDKITSLEERVKTLEQQLSVCDPNVYLSQLQHRIVCMQDGSRRFKEFRIWCPMHGKKVVGLYNLLILLHYLLFTKKVTLNLLNVCNFNQYYVIYNIFLKIYR